MGVIIRQSIKGTIVNYIGTFIGFLTTFFVVTRYLTTEEVGLTRVLVDVATVLASLSQLGTGSSIIRYYPFFKNPEKRDHGFFFWTLIVPLIGFIIFGCLFFVLQQPVEHYFSQNSKLFVDYYKFIFPLGFFLLYITVFETNSNVLLRIVVPKFVKEIAIRVFSLAAYLLYAFRIVSIDNFLIIFCAGYGIATIIDIIYLFSLKRISLKPDIKFISKELRKDYLFYTLFLITSTLATTITPVLNSLFISKDMGLSSTGVFTIAMFIAVIIEIPYRSLGAISQPHISQALKDHNIKEINKLCQGVSLHQLLAGCFLFFIIWINIDLFFELLPNGDMYASGKWVVLILGLSKLFNATLSVGVTVLSYSKYYYNSLFFTIILTLTAIILNIYLIPSLGINGAALATGLSYLSYYLLMVAFNGWKLKTNPFSTNQIKIIVIIAGMFLINWFIVSIIRPAINSALFDSLFFNIAESLIRTVILVLAGVIISYKWRVSEEVNKIVDRLFRIKQ